MNRQTIRSTTGIEVETRGEVTSAAPDYARAKIAAVVDRLDAPILAVRVKLTQEPHRSVARPSLAQAVVDIDGRPVRAHVAAATMAEAVDLLQNRLRSRIERLRHHDDHHRRHPSEPRIQDDGGTGHRPQRRELPADERRIVRHKSYGLPRRTAREALSEMDTMDYDFHLFTDAGTGRDRVVSRDPAATDLSAPELTVGQAVDRLELSGVPFVFFTDTATGRGNVLYHRYDGHYGLITPAL